MRAQDFKKQITAENKQLEQKLKTDMSHQVAKLLVEARLYKGLTQAKLAELAGTKQPSVARLEGGATEPNLGFLQRLIEAMDLTLLPPRVAELERLNNCYESNAATVTFAPPAEKPVFMRVPAKTVTSDVVIA